MTACVRTSRVCYLMYLSKANNCKSTLCKNDNRSNVYNWMENLMFAFRWDSFFLPPPSSQENEPVHQRCPRNRLKPFDLPAIQGHLKRRQNVRCDRVSFLSLFWEILITSCSSREVPSCRSVKISKSMSEPRRCSYAFRNKLKAARSIPRQNAKWKCN